MSSSSTSSTSDEEDEHRNPNPDHKPDHDSIEESVEDRLSQVALAESNDLEVNAVEEERVEEAAASIGDIASNGAVGEISGEEDQDREEEVVSYVDAEELIEEKKEEEEEEDRTDLVVEGFTNSVEVAVEEEEVGWIKNNSEVEDGDGGSSASSSGYAGGMGSSRTASSTSGSEEIRDADGGNGDDDDEIREVENGASVEDGVVHSQEPWVPGKRHPDEDDASMSWRKRKKHFFVLSNAGKPIYSRYGDEHKLAGFSATLQAIISFVENGGDVVHSVRAGKHLVIFLVKGPIYSVCISCTEEPYESLLGQLELIYGQMILILTKAVNRCFQKNPKFDMTPLLGGTDAVFSSLIHSFSWNPATFLHAYTCLPLAYATRQAAGSILQDVADSGVLFAILMCKHKVISLVGAQKGSLRPDDIMLLSNFVMSSESFKTSESFSPICLPRYNPTAFLHAYVNYLDVDTYIMLLTTSSDAFYHLKDCRIRIEAVLLKSHVLSEVQRSLLDGGMRVEDLPTDPLPRSGTLSPHLGQPKPDVFNEAFVGIGGPAGLWHFIYRSIYLDQYISSEFSPPMNTPRQQKRLYRAYQRLYASMHDQGIGPHKTQFRRDENYVLLCWVTPDFELYAAFDPLADKALAITTCNRVCQWVKDVENEIFLLGASPFSW